MGEQDIRAMGAAVDGLVRMLDREIQEIRPLLASLEALPQMTRDTQKAVQEGLSDVQQVLVRLRLAEITAEFETNKQAIEALQDVFEETAVRLEEGTERLGSRYRDLMDAIDRKTESEVRALDGPVIAILEKFYHVDVQERYRQRLMPTRAAVDTKAGGMERLRSVSIQSALGAVRRAVDNAVATMRGIRTAADMYSRTTVEPGEHFVPVLVVRHASGEIEAAMINSYGELVRDTELTRRAASAVSDGLDSRRLRWSTAPGQLAEEIGTAVRQLPGIGAANARLLRKAVRKGWISVLRP
jgi:hypothetical protein